MFALHRKMPSVGGIPVRQEYTDVFVPHTLQRNLILSIDFIIALAIRKIRGGWEISHRLQAAHKWLRAPCVGENQCVVVIYNNYYYCIWHKSVFTWIVQLPMLPIDKSLNMQALMVALSLSDKKCYAYKLTNTFITKMVATLCLLIDSAVLIIKQSKRKTPWELFRIIQVPTKSDPETS